MMLSIRTSKQKLLTIRVTDQVKEKVEDRHEARLATESRPLI